jgi:hypothetical protein
MAGARGGGHQAAAADSQGGGVTRVGGNMEIDMCNIGRISLRHIQKKSMYQFTLTYVSKK